VSQSAIKPRTIGFATAAVAAFAFLLVWLWGASGTGILALAKTAPKITARFAGSSDIAAPSTSTLSASGHEGPFEVFGSGHRKPSVRIGNESEITLRFTLRSADGRLLSMDVPPFSDKVLEADVGYYSAEVLDPSGTVKSAAGDAKFTEFNEYRASFWIGAIPGMDNFHIGD
jgi:hypothetical protein